MKLQWNTALSRLNTCPNSFAGMDKCNCCSVVQPMAIDKYELTEYVNDGYVVVDFTDDGQSWLVIRKAFAAHWSGGRVNFDGPAGEVAVERRSE